MDFTKIVEDIRKKDLHPGSYADFGSDNYVPIKLDTKNFRKIIAKPEPRRIVYIDGGNNEIISSSHFSLHLIKIYYCIYKENKRERSKKYEFLCLSSGTMKKEKVFYEVKTYPMNYSIDVGEYDSFDENMKEGGHRVSPSRICEAVRKLAEINIATRVAEELDKGDIIVIDGDLLSSGTYEKEYFDKLFRKAEESGLIVCGLCKTTNLLTNRGHSLPAVLEDISPGGKWYYYPIAKNNNPDHPADILIVKLHERSKYLFRLDVYNKTGYDPKFISILKENSKDPVFMGYPYGMIEADKFARVSNSEAEIMKVKIKIAAGKDWGDIERSLHAIDAHDILDNIS